MHLRYVGKFSGHNYTFSTEFAGEKF